MFPIRDENPHFLRPVVTYAVIAANVAAWLLVQGYGSDPLLARSVCELGLIPGELLGTIPPGTTFPLTDETVCVIGAAQSLLYPRVRVDMLIVLGFYITRTGVPAIFMLGY